jgi:hypothetical protein
LVLRQLWDGQEIKFLPESEVEFFGTERNFPLKFTKGEKGVATKVLAFNKDVWIKDESYQPVLRVTTQLSNAQLKVLEGKYKMQQNKDLVVQVTAKEDHLMLKQLWDGIELEFVAESEVKFSAKNNQTFPIRFIKNSEGVIIQLIAFEKDLLDKVVE